MNIADYVVQVLVSRQVRQIFGYPGASILPLMEAISLNADSTWMLMRHEGSASLAASAQAKLRQQLAVCMATAGPGASNLVTGLLDAQLDRVPLLAITGEIPMPKQGRYGFQDLDNADILKPFVALSVRATHPYQVPVLLRDCIGRAESDRVAVNLTIPRDVQWTEINPADPRFSLEQMPSRLELMPAPSSAYSLVASELSHINKLVIAVGPRARGCGKEIEALAEHLNAPLVYSSDSKGVLDDRHDHVMGVLGVFGLPGMAVPQKLVGEADAILAFGLEDLGPFLTDDLGYQQRKLYLCEPDFALVTRQYRCARTLIGPLAATATQLIQEMPHVANDGLISQAASIREKQQGTGQPTGKGVDPALFLGRLSEYLGADSTVALDIGDNTLWALASLKLSDRQQVLNSNKLGTMGFCLPALIAAQLTRPNGRAIGICGDGGFQMVLNEWGSAVQSELPLIMVVLSNGQLHRVEAQQKQPYGTTLRNPDFTALARSYGSDGADVRTPEEIVPVLKQAFAPRTMPYLITVHCDPGCQIPFGAWDAPVLA